MWMATTQDQFVQRASPHQPPDKPAEPCDHPGDVVRSRDLPTSRKREILAAWASDASAVQDHPTQRWLLGTPAPVPLDDVLAALRALDTDPPETETSASATPVRIDVAPCGDGWAVRCAGVVNEQIFRSGRTAEHVARRLGERLAAAGRWAEIHIRLRNGRPVGRFVCTPS